VSHDVRVRALEAIAELRACEALQSRVWGFADREVVPAVEMRSTLHAGGLVAGAFVGDELVGFVYGIPAFAHESGLTPRGMHSTMLAVAPEARGLGLGRQLKWFQRRWCLERGLEWMTWTFDPLQARNARLNLEHLGAVVHEVQVDFYGVLGDALSGDYPSDRLVALWRLASPRVAGRAGGDPHAIDQRVDGDLPGGRVARGPGPGAAWALVRDAAGGPTRGSTPDLARDLPGDVTAGLESEEVWVAAPRDIGRLRREEPAAALAWAEAFRAAALDLVARRYEANAFLDGAYRWSPRELESE
jgi:predicted GNAT superfamily acetyltransferase